ncbi:hypothetical protein [Caulobacter sp.]|uniref:hypothetical protein n=1 Tax=Caulobacter sp. TaxID=78 RepID=UPI003BA84364
MIPERLVLRSRWVSVLILVALLGIMLLPQAASAEHICGGRSDEYVVSEVYVAGGGVVESWCEWSSKGAGNSGAAMRYYSAEEWKAFADHGAQVEAANSEERRLAAQRYRQLQQGVWFLPGEQPFAGWSSPQPASASRATAARKDCTVSYWTLSGAVIMSANGGGDDKAFIRYMGYSIPLPSGSQTRKFSLTQSGETQTVTAVISRAGLDKRKMGMVSFVVPTADLLVRSIEDSQDYYLSENGKTIFSGRWHEGLKARDALAQCLAQRG